MISLYLKTIDEWLAEAGGRAYVDEEGWEECARQLERTVKAMRSALSEAENELRCFGSFDGHIARWERSIKDTANKALSESESK